VYPGLAPTNLGRVGLISVNTPPWLQLLLLLDAEAGMDIFAIEVLFITHIVIVDTLVVSGIQPQVLVATVSKPVTARSSGYLANSKFNLNTVSAPLSQTPSTYGAYHGIACTHDVSATAGTTFTCCLQTVSPA
jgi:hypothetical protein